MEGRFQFFCFLENHPALVIASNLSNVSIIMLQHEDEWRARCWDGTSAAIIWGKYYENTSTRLIMSQLR